MLNETNSVLIYDGDCGFCNYSLSLAYDRLSVMPAVEPYQASGYSKFGLKISDVENAVYLCGLNERYNLRGHLAIAQVFKWQPKKLYVFLGYLMSNPILSPIFGVGYFLVAKYRRFLPGGTPSCGVKPYKN